MKKKKRRNVDGEEVDEEELSSDGDRNIKVDKSDTSSSSERSEEVLADETCVQTIPNRDSNATK